MKRIGRAVLMGLAWALAWAPIAVVIGVTIIDPDNSMDEMWPAIGAYPGFLCGLIFSAMVGIAERGRGLGELPLLRAGAWGVAAGLLVSAIPFAIGDAGPDPTVPLWRLAAGFMGTVILLSAASAVGSASVARFVTRRQRQAPAGVRG